MNYFIKRDETEYGPYSLADLQKYIASGNVLLTDLCRSEGLADWTQVSQVIGNIPVPAAPAPVTQPVAGTVYGAPTGYGAPAATLAAPVVSPYPAPPSLHWGLVLLFTFLTCGIFGLVWLIVEGVWIRKVKPGAKSFTYLMVLAALWAALVAVGFYQGLSAAATGQPSQGVGAIALFIDLIGFVMHIVTVFAMRSDIEDHFNSAEPIGLSLSGVMTFFFAVFYFQYHFTRINDMKRRQVTGQY